MRTVPTTPASHQGTMHPCLPGPAVVLGRLAHLLSACDLTWPELAVRSGLTLDQLAPLRDGQCVPSHTQLAALLTAVGAGAELEALQSLARMDAGTVTDRMPGWAVRLAGALNSATGWRAGGGSVIPLGLRTTDHHAHWISTVLPAVPDAERPALDALATTVATSAGRHRAYLDLAILHRPTGGPATAAAQLAHLVALVHSKEVDLRLVEGPATGTPLIEITTTAGGLLVVDVTADGARYRTGDAAATHVLALDTLAYRASCAQATLSQLGTAATWMHVRTAPRRVRAHRPGGHR
ncbi:Scr1 family TA system antitoxin-like transcriptional regulator [Kitasatospora sp. NPDC091257]|uniref:Scr1 family TA system antitoxin-like transcriptional regulator n=1 Tax=Kitasatospora sp. NPDC091257 TaxID=3364084 RepID=UPI00381FCA8C